MTESSERKKVYDPILRIIHAWNGIAILFLLITAWAGELFEKGPAAQGVALLHIVLGYGLIGGFIARLIWGLIGPREARLSRLWHLRTWLRGLRELRITASNRWGHDPWASAAYLVLYLLIAILGVSGLFLAAIEHGVGPLAQGYFDDMTLKELFKEPHELAAFGVLAFIVVHIGALIWHERKDGVPHAQSMLSGYQYRRKDANMGEGQLRKDPPSEKCGRKISALLVIGLFLGVGTAHSARAAEGSVSVGDRFYHQERTKADGTKVSCATCHTADPRKAGLTRANKVIEPLAPSVNPQRFTDAAKMEKWFKRNCNDVLERVCTEQEKADFIAYVRSAK